VPALTSPVMDRAHLLTPKQRAALEERLQNFERNTGRVVVVHTTPSLEGMAINEYSSRVAERWRMRRSELESGAILTFAPAERKVNIEVGPRLQGALADPEVYELVQERIIDEFRHSDVAGGIAAGVDAILVAVARTGRPALAPASVDSTPLRGTFASLSTYDWATLALLLATLLGISWIVIGSERAERTRRRSERGRASDDFAYESRPLLERERRGRASAGSWQPVDGGDTGGWTYYDAPRSRGRGLDGGDGVGDD
jgi:uncharacterized membrane protein YgcG